jgi:DNA-binding response OmpR family regulator
MKILVIEDNEELALGLRNNLEIEGYDVDVASDGKAGLEAALRATANLIVLDLMLPEMDGFRVLRALRDAHVATPVLILTARGAESDKVRGLKLGADDYVTKPFGVLELLARVEALLRRTTHVRPRALDALGDVTVDRGARVVTRGGTEVLLTPKELDLLLALLERNGTVASRVELMRDVWGYVDSVVSRTVDTHIAELRRKLEDDPRSPRYIVTVKKAGYRLER